MDSGVRGYRTDRRTDRPSASPRPGSSRRSVASATPTTTLWPRRSTAFTRPRSSGGSDHGRACPRSKWQPCAGSIGSTTGASSAPSGTSCPQKPRPNTMQPTRPSIWSHDSNETASGKPGTLQIVPGRSSFDRISSDDVFRTLSVRRSRRLAKRINERVFHLRLAAPVERYRWEAYPYRSKKRRKKSSQG